MKSINYLLLFLVFALFSQGMCSKEEDDNPDQNSNNNNNTQLGNGTMTATIDGNAFTADQNATARYVLGSLIVSGFNANQEIQLSVYNPGAETGDFPVSYDAGAINTGTYIHSQNVNENFYSYLYEGNNDGNINITEFSDTRVKGEFYFTAKNSNDDEVTITDGTFDAELIETDFNFWDN
ncbi:MAG: hypothetical protein KDC05_10620 [Bacteroidales bacterium]|nr:hypothetical protein [Bacteroidales bacterium]